MIKIENIKTKHKNGIYSLIEKVNQVDNLGYSLEEKWLDYIIKEQNESVFIGTKEDEVIALATCMINEMDNSHAMINIIVDPMYRKQGIGSKLYDVLMTYAKDKNIKTVEVYIKERLDAAVRFVEKRNFSAVLYVWKLDLKINDFKIDSSKLDDRSLIFRQATIKDRKVYKDIINQAFDEKLDESALELALQDPSVRIYLLENHGQALATVSMQIRTSLSTGYIYDVAVVKECRGRGYGRYMLEKSIEKLQSMDIDLATLTVSGENKEALSLYHKIGFKEMDMDILGSKSLLVL